MHNPDTGPLAPQPTWAELETDQPVNNFAELTNLSGEWKRKTDWCCDGIIANDD